MLKQKRRYLPFIIYCSTFYFLSSNSGPLYQALTFFLLSSCLLASLEIRRRWNFGNSSAYSSQFLAFDGCYYSSAGLVLFQYPLPILAITSLLQIWRCFLPFDLRLLETVSLDLAAQWLPVAFQYYLILLSSI